MGKLPSPTGNMKGLTNAARKALMRLTGKQILIDKIAEQEKQIRALFLELDEVCVRPDGANAIEIRTKYQLMRECEEMIWVGDVNGGEYVHPSGIVPMIERSGRGFEKKHIEEKAWLMNGDFKYLDEYYNHVLSYRQPKATGAMAIVFDLIHDLRDRRGLKQVFNAMHGVVQDEIVETWIDIVERGMPDSEEMNEGG